MESKEDKNTLLLVFVILIITIFLTSCVIFLSDIIPVQVQDVDVILDPPALGGVTLPDLK